MPPAGTVTKYNKRDPSNRDTVRRSSSLSLPVTAAAAAKLNAAARARASVAWQHCHGDSDRLTRRRIGQSLAP
eukprot:3240122-Rhodomonas_salina.1